LVDRYGRKPFLTYSLAGVALATAGMGIATSFEELYMCRLLAGGCVAILSTGATMMMTDVSTPLNRATTIAPAMSAFSAGTAFGPALGGFFVDRVGLHSTFYIVGLCFLGVSAVNQVILRETQPKALTFPWQKSQTRKQPSLVTAVKGAIAQWKPLLDIPGVRPVMAMNAVYWVALAGSQMTLLPLILTDSSGLAMSATQVGQVYGCMSVVQIVGNPIFARAADRIGKGPTITAGCAIISMSMAGLTLSSQDSIQSMALALGTWAVGSSMLSTAPVAYISDKVEDGQRAQALALLRTCGDVGFLLGATGAGALADWSGSYMVAMQSSAGILMLATVAFAARQSQLARPPFTQAGTVKED
jgi:MFS family permease